MVTIHLCLHKIPVRISLQLPKGGIPFRVTPAEDVMGEIVVNPADCQSKADNTTIL